MTLKKSYNWYLKKKNSNINFSHFDNTQPFVKFVDLKKNLSIINEICNIYNFSKIGINPEILQFLLKLYNEKNFILHVKESLDFLVKNWFIGKMYRIKNRMFSKKKFFFFSKKKKIKIKDQIKYFIFNLQIIQTDYFYFEYFTENQLNTLKIFYIFLKSLEKLSLLVKNYVQISNPKILNVKIKTKNLLSKKILFLKNQYFFFFFPVISKILFQKTKMVFLFYNNIFEFMKITQKKIPKMLIKNALLLKKSIYNIPFINLKFLKNYIKIFFWDNFMKTTFQKILLFNKDQQVFQKEFGIIIKIYSIEDCDKVRIELINLNSLIISFFFQVMSIFFQKFMIKAFYFRICNFGEKIFEETRIENIFKTIFFANFSLSKKRTTKKTYGNFLIAKILTFNPRTFTKISLYFIKIKEILTNYPLIKNLSKIPNILPEFGDNFTSIYKNIKNNLLFFFQTFRFLLSGYFFEKLHKNFHILLVSKLKYFLIPLYFYGDMNMNRICCIFKGRCVFYNLKNFEKIQNSLNLKCLGSKFKIFVLGKIVNKFLFRIFNLEKQFFSQLFFRLVQNFFLRLNSTINSLPLKKLHEIRFKYYICNEFRLNNFLFNGNKKKRLYP